jgi:hypothetical protein
VYDSESSSAEPEKAAVETLVAPPLEELRILLDLAKKGKIMGIRERIAKIEQLGREYGPFAAELGRLAKSFDMDQLKKFLMPHLEGKP